MAVVTIFETSSCGDVLKAEVDKMLLIRMNKKSLMNIIMCSPQRNIHRTTQTDFNAK